MVKTLSASGLLFSGSKFCASLDIRRGICCETNGLSYNTVATRVLPNFAQRDGTFFICGWKRRDLILQCKLPFTSGNQTQTDYKITHTSSTIENGRKHKQITKSRTKCIYFSLQTYKGHKCPHTYISGHMPEPHTLYMLIQPFQTL